jgi:viologen exporter family transport system permease protein
VTSTLNKYLSIAKIAMLQVNGKALVGLSLFLITCLLIFAHLWRVAAPSQSALFLSPEQLLWYIAFNEWVLISLPEICFDIEQDLRSGQLAYFLPRPVSYIWAKFAEGVGGLLVNLFVLGLVTFLFTWYWSGTLPFQPHIFGLVLITGVLAGLVGLLFQCVIGLSAFWLREISPFFWIWEKLLFVLGGLILPLVAYPEWLRAVSYWTPFPVILGERSALVFTVEWGQVGWLLSLLSVWILIGIGLVNFLYHRGLKIVNIEGG